ncbi:MAG: hypothetical protein MEQ74_04985 [Paracoccus sp.]|nr:hypothetical protein [Paracoccus sp. (in: a-proteobacteria)]
MNAQTFTKPSDAEMAAIRRLYRGWDIKSILQLAKAGDADAFGCLGRMQAHARKDIAEASETEVEVDYAKKYEEDQRKAEGIKPGIVREKILDDDGKDAVLLKYTLSNGELVGLRLLGDLDENRESFGMNTIAHSVLFHEERIAAAKGGAS